MDPAGTQSLRRTRVAQATEMLYGLMLCQLLQPPKGGGLSTLESFGQVKLRGFSQDRERDRSLVR